MAKAWLDFKHGYSIMHAQCYVDGILAQELGPTFLL